MQVDGLAPCGEQRSVLARYGDLDTCKDIVYSYELYLYDLYRKEYQEYVNTYKKNGVAR